MKNRLVLVFLSLLLVLFLVSCVEPESELKSWFYSSFNIPHDSPTVLPESIIGGFGSKTNGTTINFYWKYLDSDFDYLEVLIKSKDGTFTMNETIIDTSITSLKIDGIEGTIYEYSFTPYDTDGVVGKTYTGTRYVEPSLQAKSGLIRVDINTKDNEWPTCDKVSPPEESYGAGITNNDYVYCSVTLTNSTGDKINKKGNRNDLNCKIKIRGNASAYGDKIPYKIKLDKKEDLVSYSTGRTGECYEDKNWLLLTAGTTLNNVVGFATTEYLGIEFAPAYSYVELYINGDYRGIYMIVENVKEGEARCAVSEDGFVIENDAYWWNEDVYVVTSKLNKRITFKYPDPEDLTAFQMTYITNYLNCAEHALCLKDDSYLDFYDGDTFSSWAMIQEYLGQADHVGGNQYMIKRDSTSNSKLEMTTAWDFDCIMIDKYLYQRSIMNWYNFFIMDELFSKDSFVKLCNEKYKTTKDGIASFVCSKIDLLDETAINNARIHDGIRWGTNNQTVSQQKAEVVDWFTKRVSWMSTIY